MRGLYVHIPFCVKKCAYCDFYSLPDRQSAMQSYVQALLIEAEKYQGLDFETLYFGGGTPSLLGAENLRVLSDGLRKLFRVGVTLSLDTNGTNVSGNLQRDSSLDFHRSQNDKTEATIEVNPESAAPDFLKAALECGFNRISIGVQSLNDAELKAVGRIHTATQAIDAVKQAQAAGFQNISCDLIIGLPGQTWRSLKSSISKLLALKIQHISVYCLSLENETPLADDPPENLPSDDKQVELFEKAAALLKSLGFGHYEISNFALPDYECQHNLNYWREGEYLGLGPAAASHLETIRFKNKPDLDVYLKRPTAQTTEVEQLDREDKAREETILRLRLLQEGINLSQLRQKYGMLPTQEIVDNLAAMAASGELTREGVTYRLHPAYIMTSNQIFARIMARD
ncbi:MAG: coproporphyrinogen-III oxidase family protein [Dehalococcoidales bacterium]|nr:coproporphyrinogen-III oxidase family protein [Dehalococcoidales bacterium]